MTALPPLAPTARQRPELRRRGRWSIVAAAALLVAAAAGCHLEVVSDDPANWTPDVLDGQVNAVVQVDDTVYLGGSFTRVREASQTAEVARTNFVAFDASTGELRDLAPVFDGVVDTIVAAPDGASLYVGGHFSTVDGTPSRSLVRLDVATGAPVPGFVVPPITGRVRDLRLLDGRLWLAGAFTHVGGVHQPALATIDAATGGHDPFMARHVTGAHNGGTTQVLKIDATPDGRRLFAIGNFTAVGGVPARQVASLDLGGSAAQLGGWRTSFYSATCSSSFNTYMRDLDVSPDGRTVVFTTTGSYSGGPPGPCDTIASFDATATGADVRPRWVAYTGGDTVYAVHVTDAAVYIGGHFRWLNNPTGGAGGRGAVARSGLAALDPANGLPLSWDPGRTLGVGVFDMLETDAGLWVASDTDRIGNFELHGRIAFFPWEGGGQVPHNGLGWFPGRAIALDPATANNAVHAWTFDGTTAGGRTALPNGGVTWDDARGAVMLGGTVYVAFRDGSFVARTFDGTNWGPADPVDGADQLNVDTVWHNEVRAITGMFFLDGRLHYTVAGNRNLLARAFTPESQMVGAERHTVSGPVSGLDFANVRSMFIGDGHLWWTTSNGDLRRIDWNAGAPVPGTAELMSGPAVDGVDWRARAVFLDTAKVDAAAARDGSTPPDAGSAPAMADEPDTENPDPTPVPVPPADEAPSSTGVVADDAAAEVDDSP